MSKTKLNCCKCGKDLGLGTKVSSDGVLWRCEDCCEKEQPKYLMDKISDLEAKLAESEKKYQELKELDDATTESLYASREYLDRLKSEKWALEKKLAEKDKLINDYADSLEQEVNENADLVFKLAEKEKENNELHTTINKISRDYSDALINHNQNKISFAVEQLEKVKETINKSGHKILEPLWVNFVVIDTLIN